MLGSLLTQNESELERLYCRLAEEINFLSTRLGLEFLPVSLVRARLAASKADVFAVQGPAFEEQLRVFLVNYGDEFLWEVEQVLETFESRTYLLDFLCTSLQMARLEAADFSLQPPTDALAESLCDLVSELQLSLGDQESTRSVLQKLLPEMGRLLSENAARRIVDPKQFGPEQVEALRKQNLQVTVFFSFFSFSL